VKIGRATRRAIIVLHLTPEDAEDMANEYGPSDLAYPELMQAARAARITLGETVEATQRARS
jgi:hypothetical protein